MLSTSNSLKRGPAIIGLRNSMKGSARARQIYKSSQWKIDKKVVSRKAFYTI